MTHITSYNVTLPHFTSLDMVCIAQVLLVQPNLSIVFRGQALPHL